MRAKHECVVLYNAKLTDDQIKYHIRNWIATIKDGDGKVTNVDDMGRRKLAYDIKGHANAYYVIYYFYADADEVEYLERMLRIQDDVLKFLTLRITDDDRTERAEVEYVLPDDDSKSEQDTQTDALDVLLGLADYKKK